MNELLCLVAKADLVERRIMEMQGDVPSKTPAMGYTVIGDRRFGIGPDRSNARDGASGAALDTATVSSSLGRECRCDSAFEKGQQGAAERMLATLDWDEAAVAHFSAAAANNSADAGLKSFFADQVKQKIGLLAQAIDDTKESHASAAKRNGLMMDAFKQQIKKGPAHGNSSEDTIFSNRGARSFALGASSSRAGSFSLDSSSALAALVESEGFSRHLDKQIVSTIMRLEAFKKCYAEVLGPSELDAVIAQCEGKIVARLAARIKSGDTAAAEEEYKSLREALGVAQRDPRPLDGGDERAMVGRIAECVNKGNLECDRRFLAIIKRTIGKLGVYDDPVLGKMTVQFVLCKRYVEDFIHIKETLQEYVQCDL